MHQPDRSAKAALTAWIPSQLGGGYRWFTGSLAYVLHRVSGLALLVFLFFHILSVMKATSSDPSHYDLMIRRMQEPDFKFGEIALYAALLFHGINGLRLLLVDFVLERSHVSKRMFWLFSLLVLVLLVIGSIPLLLHSNVAPLHITDALPGAR